jgi:hypothetical protein
VRLLLALLLTGCIVGDEATPGRGNGGSAGSGDPTGSGSGDPNDRPIPTNGLILDVALAAQLPTTPLGAVNGKDVVVTNATFDTPGGHALMKYVATCALPADQTLVIGGDRFEGFYGLAPQWATAGCADAECQHWVSACLLAHANQRGTPVAISLRSDVTNAFVLAAQQLASFTYQEAAFYGDLFTHELYACMGTDSFTGEDPQKFLEGRVCGLGACGLQSTGVCAPLAAPYDHGSCTHQPQPGGGYGDCHLSANDTTTTYHEVVTVYLEP